MEKLHLSLDELQVQSFTTDLEGTGQGTVHARCSVGVSDNEPECATGYYYDSCRYSCEVGCTQEETCAETGAQCNNEGSWWVTCGYSGGFC